MALFNSKEAERNAKPENKVDTHPQPAAAASLEGTRPIDKPGTAAHSNTAPVAEGRAYLDSSSKISGKLSFDGPTRIDGQVDGEITSKDALVIGESAVITAQIKAGSVTVAGKVSGDISAAQRIEIRPSAKVLGNLTTAVLVVHEGALFEGHCSMQSDAARDDRKVTVFPKDERLAQAAGQKQA
jgi:cytoskeletal protein CcmA (bactofilin family)